MTRLGVAFNMQRGWLETIVVGGIIMSLVLTTVLVWELAGSSSSSVELTSQGRLHRDAPLTWAPTADEGYGAARPVSTAGRIRPTDSGGGVQHRATPRTRPMTSSSTAASVPPSASPPPVTPRYLLWTMNPGEGLSLSRDVFLRVYELMTLLRDDPGTLNGTTVQWTLVLVPFSNPHWRDRQWASWKSLFEHEPLTRGIAVMPFEEFLELGIGLDSVLHLEPPRRSSSEATFGAISTSEWPCRFEDYPGVDYRVGGDGRYRGAFWGLGDKLSAAEFHCVHIFGNTKHLAPLVRSTAGCAVVLARAERVLHSDFGGIVYWEARRRMVYAAALRKEATSFANDISPEGKYLAVHMRRGDFLFSRRTLVPSIKDTALQLTSTLSQHGLTKLFIATDSREGDTEFIGLAALLPKDVETYMFPSGRVSHLSPPERLPQTTTWSDAQLSIIDVLVCAQATYFIGTKESTLTSRVQEDRELMGKSVASSYELLCARSRSTAGEESPCGQDIERPFPPILSRSLTPQT